LAQRAMDLGFEGLMVEVHCDPERAMSDSRQQLSPEQFSALLACLTVRDTAVGNADALTSLARMRAKIDELDENLLLCLERRQEISEQIGKLKKDNNIAILQSGRWEEVMMNALRRGEELGLDRDFVREIFNLIHGYSISRQH